MAKNVRLFVLIGCRNPTQKVCCNWFTGRSTSTSSAATHLAFVPRSDNPSEEHIAQLQDFILHSKKLFVLTGAGISTESGIPDYRSEGVGLYATSRNRPVQYADFLKSAEIRQRYWARNYVGWPRFSSFQPNDSHKILSKWEHAGKVHWLVTQNVDTLHYKARSMQVTELHGSAHQTICLSCHRKFLRTEMQERIKNLNPSWHAHSLQIAPDGDVSLSQEQVQGFKVPECTSCGGILKPEIVFFGDNVPRSTVDLVNSKLDESDSVLVIGSSLEVYSGYRIATRAHKHGIPLAILNIGKTRADGLAQLKISARCGEMLRQIQSTWKS